MKQQSIKGHSGEYRIHTEGKLCILSALIGRYGWQRIASDSLMHILEHLIQLEAKSYE